MTLEGGDRIIARLRCRAFSLVELLVVIAIISVLLALLLPAIQAAREAARRSTCMDNMKQVGLAFQTFHDSYERFPSAGTAAANKIGGWSFLVRLLPCMEYGEMYDNVSLRTNPIPTGAAVVHSGVDKTVISELICPGTTRPDTASTTGTLTCYKAMSATTAASLATCVGGQPPSHGAVHPDGALYPGGTTTVDSFGQDGGSHTILCAETMADPHSRWYLAAETFLVGLPESTGGGPTVIAASTTPGVGHPYAYPENYSGGFDAKGHSGAAGLTWLDASLPNRYGDEAGAILNPILDATPIGSLAPSTPENGPSSGHPIVANHLFADGAVRSISKRVDVAAYMFTITRDGGDPPGPVFGEP